MKTNYTFGKVGIVTVLLSALTGCTTYVVQQPEPQPAYVPPPQQQPVYVQEAPPAPPPPAVVVIQREDDFVQPLSPYGEWVVVGSYGRVWRPARVEANWRPYSNGHWELTGDGWYWVSDEPWAWATYHYGRWQLAGNYGWVWVPQTQWAPAWVSWREGGGYVGWAPLPPEPRGGVSINVNIAPAAFCYVEESRIHEPVRPTTVIVNNTTIINKTVNITKTKVVNKVVINEGPRREEVERATGRKIQEASISDLRHKDEEPVAEKHQNLRAHADRGQQPEQKPELKQPEPQPAPKRPGQEKRIDQNLRPDAEKPARVEPRPTPVLPTQPAQPADIQSDRARQQEKQQQQQQEKLQQQQQKLQQQQQKQLQLQQEKSKQQQEKEQQQQEKQRQQQERQQQQEEKKRQEQEKQQQLQQQKLQQQQEKQQQQLQKQQPQVQPAPRPQPEHPNQSGKQKDQLTPRNNRAAEQNTHGRQAGETNTVENPAQSAPK